MSKQLEFFDKVLTCKDCRQDFVFTAGEQKYFADRRLAEPKRCPTCRANRRAVLPAPQAQKVIGGSR